MMKHNIVWFWYPEQTKFSLRRIAKKAAYAFAATLGCVGFWLVCYWFFHEPTQLIGGPVTWIAIGLLGDAVRFIARRTP